MQELYSTLTGNTTAPHDSVDTVTVTAVLAGGEPKNCTMTVCNFDCKELVGSIYTRKVSRKLLELMALEKL